MNTQKLTRIAYTGLIAFMVGRSVTKARRRRSTSAEPNNQNADSPPELPGSAWKRALLETKNALRDKSLPMSSAGIAFFTTLSFFPLLAAAAAIAALVIDPGQIAHIMNSLDAYLPKDLASLVGTQLQTLAHKQASNIIVAIFAILLSLYSASAATQNLIKATNYSYDVTETRSFIKMKLISLALTLGGLVLGFALIALLLISGAFLRGVGLPDSIAIAITWLRWPLIVLILTIILAAFYRYGPNRRDPKWQWVSWGAAAATIIWLLGTALFFIYAQNYGNFGRSYGIFAGIVILMTWLHLSAFIFLLGAEVNHRLEQQTDSRTT